MSVIAAYIVPHPPLIFPEVGEGKEHKIEDTTKAYREVAHEICVLAPDAVVIVSPHAQTYADYFHISPGERASGDMRQYGVSGVEVSAEYDTEFVVALEAACEATGFPAGTLGERNASLDHGTMIPLRFIYEAAPLFTDRPSIKSVRIGISGLSVDDHYRLGMHIHNVSEQLGRRIVLIASADLSHKLLDYGPYGFAPEGPQFDKAIKKMIKSGDFMPVLELDASFCEKAGECGHRPIVVMAGALDGKTVETKLLSYEGPFGVGYGVGSFLATGYSDARRLLTPYLERQRERTEQMRAAESPHVRLARNTVETYVESGRMYDPGDSLPPEFTVQSAGVFVSIKKHGNLRGCIGTISSTKENLDMEIRHNAISAASNDPRFDEIETSELPYLTYSVDVLMPAESIDSADELDPKKYGVIVSLGGRRGLLLPDLDGIDDAEYQIEIAMQKAGIGNRERSKIKLERFEVVRHL